MYARSTYNRISPPSSAIWCEAQIFSYIVLAAMSFLLRAHNIVKHVCVAARIGDGKAPGEGNSHSIAKTSNAASADSGCNPSGWHEFWPVAPGSRRKDFVLGAETGAERRRYIPGATAPFLQTGLGLTSHGAALSKGLLLRMTKPQDFLLALSQNRDSASRVSLC